MSFRQPIRGVVTARSPSLIPRFRHTRPEALLLPEPPRSGRGNAKSRRLAAFRVPPLALEDDPRSLRPFAAAAPAPTASLVCSCLPCAAPWRDRKYITGYKSSRGCRRDVSIGRRGQLRQFGFHTSALFDGFFFPTVKRAMPVLSMSSPREIGFL